MSQISESNEGTSRFGPWIWYNCFFILSVQYRANKQLRPWEWGLNRQQFACFNACRSSPAPPPQALGVFLIIFGLFSLYKKTTYERPCAGHRNSDTRIRFQSLVEKVLSICLILFIYLFALQKGATNAPEEPNASNEPLAGREARLNPRSPQRPQEMAQDIMEPWNH